MNNIKTAKQLIKIAKNLMADETGEQTLDEAAKQGKKYILHHQENGLWRIQACKDFSDVKKGEFGGLIRSEKNLSHEGKCWVYDDAIVLGSAKVFEDAKVKDDSMVYENAKVFGNANITGTSQIYDNAKVDYDVDNDTIIW